MLKLVIQERELYDEQTGMFLNVKPTTLKLEHSLISISDWESKWHKPFLNDKQKTEEEFLDYVRCMTITQNVDPNVYLCLSVVDKMEIQKYMDDSMTATWFNEKENSPKRKQKVVTSELIYYWMISLGIPVQFEKWHINRLLTLIRVCNIENSPKKKMKPSDVAKQNSEINRARRKSRNSKG